MPPGSIRTQNRTKITSCPYTISTQGSYYLDSNLATTGDCIKITNGGSDSTLDCKGYNITGTNFNGLGINLTNTYGVTVKNCVLSYFAKGIQLKSSNNNAITGNDVTTNQQLGIYVQYSNENNLTSNIASADGQAGILLDSANGNILTGNTASWNKQSGITLMSSNNNNLTGNTVNANEYMGIDLYSSNENSFTGNTAIWTQRNGFNVINSNNNEFTSNNASSNTMMGFYVGASNGNIFEGNTIHSNKQDGINISASSTNTHIEHNNIVGSGKWDIECKDVGSTERSGNTCASNGRACSGCPGTCTVNACN